MTVIDPKNDTIGDFFFKDVVMTKSEDSILFVTESEMEKLNVFILVEYLNRDSDTFFKLFGNYDGTIFGLNNR